ncbi:MAG: DNA-binding response regulator [Acidimicrobiaceae bacterium]|nr:DNA-binding response regulator [Acidimicrobiaceae bacterium]
MPSSLVTRIRTRATLGARGYERALVHGVFTGRWPPRRNRPAGPHGDPSHGFLTKSWKGTSVHRVLIAEDDRRVRSSLERALTLEGYEVVTTGDGASALQLHAERPADLLLLDVSMPNADGLSVCRRLRAQGDDTPVLMLTARHEVHDRVAGLDAGADDYVVKPFALDELLARLRARLRSTVTDEGDLLVLDDLRIDVAGRLATRQGRVLDLSRTEFDLLEVLVGNAGVVLSRDQLYAMVWDGVLETDSKTLDVYVGYLRKKLEVDGATRLLHTVRGMGYVARAGDG